MGEMGAAEPARQGARHRGLDCAGRPSSLTAAHALRCLPFPRRIVAAGRRRRGGRIETVWPDERLTLAEATYVQELAAVLGEEMLALAVLGERDRTLGRLLRRAAKRALRGERGRWRARFPRLEWGWRRRGQLTAAMRSMRFASLLRRLSTRRLTG